ncbi:MAG: hypothetical protein A2538_04530 [Candidatus Magasanikbacteria bacterium RIFOXYD2_FULL_41_14]|uniref:Uncharacterized protein n=1 Tax=Candidatus Magasanikbacteria bacterium RIFOXYD2_FULL_41_14 TaxID=1798709 RepID=A0A1F6PER1_9BACT|nr:MAG: hypothetical protein A2538_04530 [Candidatus Magasanikbacteria bacterium RIFOXYD2_FULL_41_14]
MRNKLLIIFVLIICVGLVFSLVKYYYNLNYEKPLSNAVTQNPTSTTSIYSSPEVGISFKVPVDYAVSNWVDISDRGDQLNITAQVYVVNEEGESANLPPVLSVTRFRGMPFSGYKELFGLGMTTGEVRFLDLLCGQGVVLTNSEPSTAGPVIVYHSYVFHDGQNLFSISAWENSDWPGMEDLIKSVKLLNCK